MYTCTISHEISIWFSWDHIIITNWSGLFTHILQGYFTGPGAILWLPQCQWSLPWRVWLKLTITKPNQSRTNIILWMYHAVCWEGFAGNCRQSNVSRFPDILTASSYDVLKGKVKELFCISRYREVTQWTASYVNTLRLRQDGRFFADAISKCIFLNEKVWISIKFSLKFVPTGPINNIPSLVQIMAWCRMGDKPLSEPMMA